MTEIAMLGLSVGGDRWVQAGIHDACRSSVLRVRVMTSDESGFRVVSETFVEIPVPVDRRTCNQLKIECCVVSDRGTVAK